MPVSAHDFSFLDFQAVLTAPDGDIPAARAVREIVPILEEYDGDPTILPLGAALPIEVPRIQLRNVSGSRTCQIGPGQFSMQWSIAPGEDEPQIADVVDALRDRLIDVNRILGVRIGRVAAVFRRIVRVQEPAMTLARHFCKTELVEPRADTVVRSDLPMGRLDNVELHCHKIFELLAGLSVNSWIRIQTALENTAPPQPVILAMQDINSLAEEQGTRNFDEEQIHQFFAGALAHFDRVLQLYFPARDGQ